MPIGLKSLKTLMRGLPLILDGNFSSLVLATHRGRGMLPSLKDVRLRCWCQIVVGYLER